MQIYIYNKKPPIRFRVQIDWIIGAIMRCGMILGAQIAARVSHNIPQSIIVSVLIILGVILPFDSFYKP